MQSTTDWRALAEVLSRATAQHAPAWTDRNDADPGITLLQLFAFLTESLVGERGATEAQSRAAARLRRALEAFDVVDATAEATDGSVTCWSGHTRARYFTGQLLTPDVLQGEQDYLLGTQRRHVRALHGVGVVSGLDVQLSGDPASVSVAPGFAIDPLGRELVIDCAVSLTLPAAGTGPLIVVLEYAERAVRSIPVTGLGDSAQGTVVEATAVEEGCGVRVRSAAAASDLPVARLVDAGGRWQVDAGFEPARIR